ncbi:MAG: ATP-binding protein [Bacteroidetes bacterium]|nr:ATP-binding protein [Bacteroidota bacterium]
MSFFDQDQYTIADIQSLIDNSIEESINLDFKAADALQNTDGKKKEVGKDISALANSDGGIIVYGLSEQGHVAHALSYINGNIFTKEWLEQVINTNIHRRISDIKIFPIRNNENIAESIYVVRVPASKNAPHMMKDNRFYRRFNFESVPMEEYEVRWLYNQKEKTDLEILDPIITGGGRAGELNSLTFIDFHVSFQVKNISNAIEDKFKAELKVPILVYLSAENNPNLGANTRRDGDFMICSIPSTSSLFQDDQTTCCQLNVRIRNHNKDAACNNPVVLKLYYSNGTKTKEFNLGDILQFSGHTVRQLDFRQ